MYGALNGSKNCENLANMCKKCNCYVKQGDVHFQKNLLQIYIYCFKELEPAEFACKYPQKVIECESILRLTCGSMRIVILEANYGRLDGAT